MGSRQGITLKLVAGIGDKIDINIEFVDDIPRTKSGKYRWVISNVPKGQLNKDLE